MSHLFIQYKYIHCNAYYMVAGYSVDDRRPSVLTIILLDSMLLFFRSFEAGIAK